MNTMSKIKLEELEKEFKKQILKEYDSNYLFSKSEVEDIAFGVYAATTRSVANTISKHTLEVLDNFEMNDQRRKDGWHHCVELLKKELSLKNVNGGK